jgi:putative membrane protein
MTISAHALSPRRRLALAAAATLALALPPAWAQSGTGSSGAAAGSGSSSGAAANRGSAQGSLAREDSRMLADLAQGNMAEIETGRLALDKSQNEQVRKFAQQMIDDHGSALKELQTLAQSKGMSLPDGPDVKHKTVATALRVLSGDTFDRQYLSRAGVNDHQDTLKLLQKIQTEGRDPDVKALATKMIPTVQHHLDMARQEAGRLTQGNKQSDSSGTRSGGSSGTATPTR